MDTTHAPKQDLPITQPEQPPIMGCSYDTAGEERKKNTPTHHQRHDSQELVHHLSPLKEMPKKDRKKAIMELLDSLDSDEDKEEIAEKAGNPFPGHKTVDFITRLIILAFIFVLLGSFLTFIVFTYLEVKGTDLLFTLITTTGGFLAGVFVPTPSALPRKTNTLRQNISS